MKVLHVRSQVESDENPLNYEEIALWAPRETTPGVIEQLAKEHLAKYLLETDKKHRYVKLAVFDHEWTIAPKFAPLFCCEWKDWEPPVSVIPPAPASSDEDAEALFDSLSELYHTRDAKSAAELALVLLARYLRTQSAMVHLVDYSASQLVVFASRLRPSVVVGFRCVLRSMLGDQLESGGASRLSNTDTDRVTKQRYALAGHAASQILVVPMIAHDHGVGLIELADRVDSAPFSDEDVSVVQYVASKFAEYFAQQAMFAPDLNSRTNVA